jgi:hypothetical protein
MRLSIFMRNADAVHPLPNTHNANRIPMSALKISATHPQKNTCRTPLIHHPPRAIIEAIKKRVLSHRNTRFQTSDLHPPPSNRARHARATVRPCAPRAPTPQHPSNTLVSNPPPSNRHADPSHAPSVPSVLSVRAFSSHEPSTVHPPTARATRARIFRPRISDLRPRTSHRPTA